MQYLNRVHWYLWSLLVQWVGFGDFSKVVATFSHMDGSLTYYGRHRWCLNNPIFFNVGLCAACWVHFMCHHELWPTSVSHPFSYLNSSLGLGGRKHYQKITILIFWLSIAIFSPYFLHVGLLLQLVAFQSGNWLSLPAISNWCRVAVSNDEST